MKITDRPTKTELGSYLKAASSASKSEKGSVPAKASSQPDRADFSAKGKVIQEAMSALGSVPEIRETKVEAIKARVESGTYNVKGEAVADGIIRSSILDELL